jgi:hypothetical protein
MPTPGASPAAIDPAIVIDALATMNIRDAKHGRALPGHPTLPGDLFLPNWSSARFMANQPVGSPRNNRRELHPIDRTPSRNKFAWGREPFDAGFNSQWVIARILQADGMLRLYRSERHEVGSERPWWVRLTIFQGLSQQRWVRSSDFSMRSAEITAILAGLASFDRSYFTQVGL